MKIFITRVLKFVSLTILMWLLIFIVCNIKNVIDFVSVFGSEVLSPCNSHEQCGIDYDLFQSCGNLNTIASRPWHWESKLRVYLKLCKKKPKIVLIDRGEHDVLGDQTSDQVAADYARFVVFQVLAPTCPYEVNTSDALHYIFGPRPFSVVWVAKPPMGNPAFEWEGRVKEHFGEYEEGVLPSEEHIARFIKSLESIVELAKANDIEPVLISTPKYRKYCDSIPYQIAKLNKQITDSIIIKYGVRYLDYETTIDLDEDCFLDADHLNKKGRAYFTRILMRDLGYEN